MSYAQRKGAEFEQWICDYLAEILDDSEIERRVPGGTNDKGDIAHVSFGNVPFVVEAKNRVKLSPSVWFDELNRECENAGTDMGAVVFKRDGFGQKSMGGQGVLMTLETLARLLRGDVHGDIR